MGGTEFFGAAPNYGELYYNLHAETGRCLSELERRFAADSRSPLLLVSSEPVLSRKVLLGTLKLRAAQRPERRTNVIWLDVYKSMSAASFWEAAVSALVELWFSLDSADMSYFERRLLSTGAFEAGPAGAGAPPVFVRLLSQMSGTEIVIVIDVRDSTDDMAGLLEPIMKSLDALLAEHTSNLLALIMVAARPVATGRYLRALGTTSVPIALGEGEMADLLDLLNAPRVQEAGFAQMEARRRDPPSSRGPAAGTASSLVLVGQPVLASAVRYLASVATEGMATFDMLAREGAIERLHNDGIALTNVGSQRYGDLARRPPIEEMRTVIEANGAHLLSALRPRDLHGLDGTGHLAESALSRSDSIVENVGACLAARVARSSTLAGYLGDRLAEILRSRALDWAPVDGDLLDDVLKYLSLVAFREPDLFDRGLFKLTEEMTYALNAFSLVNDRAGTHYVRAQRITRLTHLYDNAPADVRARIGHADTRRYARQALQILEDPGTEIDPSLEIEATYLSGWLRHDVGDPGGARHDLLEAALISKHMRRQAVAPAAALGDTSLAFELVAQAIFFSDEPIQAGAREVVAEMLSAHGILGSLQEMLELARSGQTGRKALPRIVSDQESRWHILFNRRDFGVGVMLASALLFEWRHPVEIICVPDDQPVGPILESCKGRRLVMGGPDSLGPIGDYIRATLPDISKLWQIRFNESFFQPVLPDGPSHRPLTVILLGSIVGDALRAWSKFVLESGIVTQGERRPMDIAILGSVLPTILTTGSKKLTELIIERLVKAIETRIEPKAREAVGDDLAGVRQVLSGAADSGSALEAQRRISDGLSAALRSKLVLTGVIDATDNGSLYRELEGVLVDMTFLDGATTHYRDMAALLRVLSLYEHGKADSGLERSRKARSFADGFSNLTSRLNVLIEDYETKAEWDVAGRNKVVNDLIATGGRFLQFARSE